MYIFIFIHWFGQSQAVFSNTDDLIIITSHLVGTNLQQIIYCIFSVAMWPFPRIRGLQDSSLNLKNLLSQSVTVCSAAPHVPCVIMHTCLNAPLQLGVFHWTLKTCCCFFSLQREPTLTAEAVSARSRASFAWRGITRQPLKWWHLKRAKVAQDRCLQWHVWIFHLLNKLAFFFLFVGCTECVLKCNAMLPEQPAFLDVRKNKPGRWSRWVGVIRAYTWNHRREKGLGPESESWNCAAPLK